jgi:hypothetical protein
VVLLSLILSAKLLSKELSLPLIVASSPLLLLDAEFFLKSRDILTEFDQLTVFVAEHLSLVIVALFKLLGPSLGNTFVDHQVLERIAHLDKLFTQFRLILALPQLELLLVFGSFGGEVDQIVLVSCHVGPCFEVQLFEFSLIVSQFRDDSVELSGLFDSEEHVFARGKLSLQSQVFLLDDSDISFSFIDVVLSVLKLRLYVIDFTLKIVALLSLRPQLLLQGGLLPSGKHHNMQKFTDLLFVFFL